MTRPTGSYLRLTTGIFLAAGAMASPLAAQDKPDMIVMIGVGPALQPKYPGASSLVLAAKPVVNFWRKGDPLPAKAADQSPGFVVLGQRGGLAAGPAVTFAPGRNGKDIAPGLADVGFGMEVGGFIEAYPWEHLRLRGELRRAIGASKGLTGDVAIDLELRLPDDRLVVTAGPRLRWGNGRYQRAYFGVDAAEALTSGLTSHRPGSGVHAYGAMTGAYYQFGRTWGVYAFAGYDRLTGDAARSPIVTHKGSRDQFSTGLSLTYRVTIGP